MSFFEREKISTHRAFQAWEVQTPSRFILLYSKFWNGVNCTYMGIFYIPDIPRNCHTAYGRRTFFSVSGVLAKLKLKHLKTVIYTSDLHESCVGYSSLTNSVKSDHEILVYGDMSLIVHRSPLDSYRDILLAVICQHLVSILPRMEWWITWNWSHRTNTKRSNFLKSLAAPTAGCTISKWTRQTRAGKLLWIGWYINISFCFP